ncbi:phosphatidate cytidylyltransferase [Methylobrevis pamukkalensis]|uniref:Phosphatidate cytidylyltransferase n=1 Tax=Methylobrevis pamukkalensis TaxID=1439726 RepID=A0A1E3H4R7_9HYPH|nr:phosphatidate cytidylyltransferase [Methylobrevis pamukkalensis]ODN71145.1 Phosphatidate cytidylyltransferase [Methylobrevis pamukkalensis]
MSGAGPEEAPPIVSANFYKRLVASLVLVPLAIGLTFAGGLAFTAMVALGGALVVMEWMRIAAPGGSQYLGRALPVFCGLVVLGTPAGASGAMGGLVLGAGLFAVAALTAGSRYLWVAAGLLYGGAPGIALSLLREGPDGFIAVVFVLVTVWTTDSCAYFAGRALGGPKLWPRVSPKKTWSGAIGGALSAVLAGLLLALVAGLPSPAVVAGIAFILSVVSQLGDLGESAVKRRFDVKDSGTIIPGHGGIMDRVDGLIPAAILAAAIGLAHGGPSLAAGLIRW